MELIQRSYRELSLVFDINKDRIIYPIAIIVGLLGGMAIGLEILELYLPADRVGF